MATINHITHPDELTQIKVNFFADYFQFFAHYSGFFQDFETETYVSLLTKAIYQIEENLDNSIPYLDSYFSHPLLSENKDYLKEFENWDKLFDFLSEYGRCTNLTNKKKWLKNNFAEFIVFLKDYKDYLDETMFSKSLEAIISYLKCTHSLEEHYEEICFNTKILVSEFLLSNHSKKDLTRVFNKLMSKEIYDFPFPLELLNESENKKKEFIENRTFDQQFEGLENLLNQRKKDNYLLFKVYGIKSNKDFSFKYNKVTFYNSKHQKFDMLRHKLWESGYADNYLQEENTLIALIKVNFYTSPNIILKEAFKALRLELEYLNSICDANATFEKKSYLWTSDFKDLGYSISGTNKCAEIKNNLEKQLDENPYKILENIDNTNCKNHFLKFEELFIRALISSDMKAFWHYLEVIFSKNNVIENISNILILGLENREKILLKSELLHCIFPITVSHQVLGITQKLQMELYNEQLVDEDKFNKNINHAFIKHIFNEYTKPYSKELLNNIKNHYLRVFRELYAQRNAIIHKGYGLEKSLIALNYSVPFLIKRFRWILMEEMLSNKYQSFDELIMVLNTKSLNLINT